MTEIINNGKGTQPKTGRNQDLIRDKLSGRFDTMELAIKYGVTPTRIGQIMRAKRYQDFIAQVKAELAKET